jgi:eukaryotic-like serine/threonine-protein kinase
MEPGRLEQIEDLYHAALEVDPTEREALLAAREGTDDDLIGEVRSLLAAHVASGAFMAGPPESLAAQMFAEQSNGTNLIGKEIGHYKISGFLAKGGMGEVYLAEDTRLDRKVALKFLPGEFARDEHWMRRFLREAKAVSALNHPNIVTIHEIGQVDEQYFIVNEFVEGSTLRNVMRSRPLSVENALRIAVQVCSGIEAAHKRGFVHRDIKPENIMVRSDGLVKILDFGLARIEKSGSANDPNSIHTQKGVIMGTASYMSPEQARGKEVDGRTDIWSLGIVLAEMITGKPPFSGETTSDVIAAILTTPAELDLDLPADIAAIVNRALEKDPSMRFRNAGEFHTELKRLLRDSDTGFLSLSITDERQRQNITDRKSSATARTGAVSKLPWGKALIGMAALIAVVAACTGLYRKYAVDGGAAVNAFQTIKMDRLTAHGVAIAAAISPDGRYTAYARDDEGKQGLWLRQNSNSGETQIVASDRTKYLFLRFSPDGEFLYFVATQGDGPSTLYQITTLGRSRRQLIVGVDSQISFSPDGKSLAFIRKDSGGNSLITADAGGGNERILHTRKDPEVYTEGVSWAPDGRLIAVGTLKRRTNFAGGIATVDVNTGVETPIVLSDKEVIRVSHLAWISDGKGIIFCQFTSPTGRRYQLRYLSYPSGVVQNVSNDLTSYEDLSLTGDSKSLVSVQREYSMGVWVTPEGDFTRAGPISVRTGRDDGELGVAWTKDGKIAYVSSEGGAQNIWRYNADGSDQKPLTTGTEEGKVFPVLSAGSGALIFLNHFDYWRMNAEGLDQQKITTDGTTDFPASANDKWIVFTSRKDGGEYRIWKSPAHGGEAARLTEVESSRPALSPDGKLVAYIHTVKGQPQNLAVISIDGGAPIKTFALPATLSASAASSLAWTKEGDAILFINTLGTTSNIWKQPLDGGPAKPLTTFNEFQIAAFALNPQNTRMVLSRGSRNRDIVLVRNILN